MTMKRKHPHQSRFHTKGHVDLTKPIPARRSHKLLSHVRGLTPMERTRLNKRIATGVYANSNAASHA